VPPDADRSAGDDRGAARKSCHWAFSLKFVGSRRLFDEASGIPE
jgi:hypothetical protein